MNFQPDYQFQVIPEDQFDEKIPQLLCQLEACGTVGTFSGEDGEKMHYEHYRTEGSKGAVVVVHGLSEFTLKYHELAWYLLNQGYDVFLYDQRGHGKSCRQVDQIDMVHVNRFTDYVTDLHRFVCDVVKPATDKPLYLYAHSMGGAVATLYLAAHPETFRKAVLSAPMIEPLTGGVNPVFARVSLAMLLPFINGKKKFWSSGEFNPEYKFEWAQDQSYARFHRNLQIRIDNPCYQSTPMSMRWVQQSVSLRPKLTRKSFLRNIRTPILMLCAETDKAVNTDAQTVFAQRCEACRQLIIPGSTHSMLNGNQEIIETHIQLMLDHFA